MRVFAGILYLLLVGFVALVGRPEAALSVLLAAGALVLMLRLGQAARAITGWARQAVG
jgi:hypothetical protein